VSAVWWWFLILGILWTALGMYVLSYRVGSLAVVATLAVRLTLGRRSRRSHQGEHRLERIEPGRHAGSSP
jgi:hypothetical protein